MGIAGLYLMADLSLPSRGAWIEILDDATGYQLFDVAPLTGSVD